MHWIKVTLEIALVALVLDFPHLARRLALRLRPDPAIAASLPAAQLTPQRQDSSGLSAALERIRAKNKLPCLAGLVLKDDRVTAQGIAGVRKARAPKRATLEDHFHLGSDTKAMTATMLAVLIEEGKLSWRTTVGGVFEHLVPNMDAGWKPVTLEQLLTHRAGAPADLRTDGLWARLWERQGTPTEQRRQLVEGVLTKPPVVAPGTKYLYSNAGYAIAGAMAEQITGKSWEELMQEKLFHPLGITSAGFGAPGTSGRVDQPWGHNAVGKPIEPGPDADNPPAIGPAGTVNMTLGDWAKFIALHLRGDAANPHRQTRLLNPETFDHLHRAADGPGQRYACGWLIAERSWAKGSQPGDTGRVLTHAGSNTMWYCVVWIAPEKDFAVLVACNQGGNVAAKACDQAASELIRKWALNPDRQEAPIGGK